MCSFIKLKKIFYRPFLIDDKGDFRVFLSKKNAKKTYEITEHTRQECPRNDIKYYRSVFRESNCKYIWVGTSKYSRYLRYGTINSVYKHPDPKLKNMVLWYLFQIDNDIFETRVVLCI